MKADDFKRRATDPDEWLIRSKGMRYSAGLLWQGFVGSTLRSNELRAAGENPDTDLQNAVDHLSSAQMLYGLAIETGLKARLLRTDPSNTRIQITTDGQGAVVEAKLTRMGVDLGRGHDLHKLATAAGVFERGKNQVFEKDADFGVLKEVLDHLADIVSWSARYPVPLSASAAYVPPVHLPIDVYTSSIRTWVDPLLDWLHSEPAA